MWGRLLGFKDERLGESSVCMGVLSVGFFGFVCVGCWFGGEGGVNVVRRGRV